jgi:catechol 2,3-dioxygenase-like lactoylglutathione lyase family enzyme
MDRYASRAFARIKRRLCLMSGAPLPLLGTFHEVSVAVDDVGAAVEFYERLGFTQAPTTDAFTHPYGVLTDGRLCIGVHRRAGPSPVLTFVRPGIAGSLPALAAAGIHLTRCRTGAEEFHEIAFADPFGHMVAVLEARTYSPVPRGAAETSACGDFAEVSLPVADFAAAQAFWEPLGFVTVGEGHSPHPHLPFTSDQLDVSFHRAGTLREPLLVFRDTNMPARIARLRALGLTLRDLPGQAAGGAAVLLAGPAGTPPMLLAAED